MKKRYDEIMDRLEVTEEMRSRVLAHLQTEDLSVRPKKPLPFRKLRWLMPVAACLAVVLICTLTLPKPQPSRPERPPVLSKNPVDASIIRLDSAEALSASVGFSVEDFTQLPFEAQEAVYKNYWKRLAEITYAGDGKHATFRKSMGNEDNSGDTTDYSAVKDLHLGAVNATLKGDDKGFCLAIWCDGNYSYSLRLLEGLSSEEWKCMIEQALCSGAQ